MHQERIKEYYNALKSEGLSEEDTISKAIEIYCIAEYQLTEEEKEEERKRFS